MNIVRKARGTEIPKQAQRVFLSYNKCDILNRDTLISDLLSMDAGMDCMVSYLEDPDTAIDEEQLQNELSETKMLVVWVTLEMLQYITPEKLPTEYYIAKESHIPILPILSDNGLFSLYREKFGSIHCIAKLDSEYRIKLKAQMEISLASEEIIRQIKEKAFTAVVFASYRKHELSEARRFMKVFHDLKGFESISVWYDNFLTAGRDFNNDIKESIINSKALVLVVTPDLATKGNYVEKEEYPFSQEIKKPVVSVETIPTSHILFADCFPDTDLPIPLSDTATLQSVFRGKLGESAFAKQLDSEHSYLLGMAYLKGIDVERDFDRAVKLLSAATEDRTAASIDAANHLANIYMNGTGTNVNYGEALQWYDKALTMCEEVLGKEHPDTAKTYNNIALVYDNQGDYLKALEWYHMALAIQEKALGREHPDTTVTYNNIASVYRSQGKYLKALEWHQKALAIKEKVLGKEHQSTATTYNNIALVYVNQGKYPNALEWYQKALAIREKVFGKEHPDTAATYNNMALVFDNQGEYAKALEWYQKALAIREKVFGKEHPDTATTYNNIALVHNNQGEYLKALELFEKALVIQEKALGKEHLTTAKTYNNIALLYNNQREYANALEWFHKALVIFEKVLSKEHPDTATAYNNIAGVCFNQGEYLKALEWFEKALVIQEKVLGKEHPETARTYNNIATVFNSQRNYPKALEWYQKALTVFEKVLGKEHPYTIITYNNIATVYGSQGEYL